MKSGQKEINAVDTGRFCLETDPCRHSVTLFYKDGTNEYKGSMYGDDIAKRYFKYLNKDDQKHFAGYLNYDCKVYHHSFLAQKQEEKPQDVAAPQVNRFRCVIL